METKAPAKEKKKTTTLSPKAKRLIIIGVAVLFLAMAAIIIILLTQIEKPKDDRATVVSQGNAEEVKAAMDKPVEDGYYEVAMNTTWSFKGDASDAYVENAKTNNRTVYFDVFRADTNELVYSSPYIPVGEKIQGFLLDADLEPGSYDGLVTYHLVDDNHEEVSNLSVKITFQVE